MLKAVSIAYACVMRRNKGWSRILDDLMKENVERFNEW